MCSWNGNPSVVASLKELDTIDKEAQRLSALAQRSDNIYGENVLCTTNLRKTDHNSEQNRTT